MKNKLLKNVIRIFAVGLLLSSCSSSNNGGESIGQSDVSESSESIGSSESVHNHVYSELIAKKDPTCVEDGIIAHYTCLECNKIFDENKNEISEADLIIPATGHTYTNHYHIDGEYHALECDVCGAVDEEHKVAHVFDKKVLTEDYKVSDHTCLKGSIYYYSCECGLHGEETFEEEDALGHKASDKWTHDETHHWHECLNECGEKLDYAEHKFDQQVISEETLKEKATCEHGNIFYYSCECGALSEETFDDGRKVEHVGSHYDYLPFSATQNGTSQYWECDVCHKIYLLEDGLFSIEKVRYSNANTLQLELPSFINIGKNFLATDAGFNVMQGGSTQQAGWFGYDTTDQNESIISVHFNNNSNEGDVYCLNINSLITDANGKEYRLDKDYCFAYENDAWKMETEPTVPAGTWQEKGSAPAVSDDDIRSVMYSIDLNQSTLGFTNARYIQEQIDIEVEADDGISFDTTGLIIKRNGEAITVGAQYFQSHIISFDLKEDNAEAGDLIIIEKGSVLKLNVGDKVINRKISSDIAYQFNGTGQWRRAKIVEFGLPSTTHVQWNMVLLQGENYFNVSGDTNCYYTGSVLANGYEYSGLPQGSTSGLYFSSLSIGEGFTFEISKGTTFDCNNILVITLKDYKVSWNGSTWAFAK